jgi:predicted dehydrogenase
MFTKIKKIITKIGKRYLLIVSKKLGDFSTESSGDLPKGIVNEAKDTNYQIGIIGFGNQGKAMFAGISFLPCATVKIICDSDSTKFKDVKSKNSNLLITDKIEEIFSLAPDLDLVIIATTAPFHLNILSILLKHFKGKILIEKPLDSSLKKTIEVLNTLTKEQLSRIFINYSKRHLPDLKNIKNIIKSNVIGDIKTIHLSLGNGELAMIASHYFDYLIYLLDEYPVKVQSTLTEPLENKRGANYEDHNGICSLFYKSGVTALFDFSRNHLKKDVQLLLKCEKGYLFFDESKGYLVISPDGMSPYVYNSMEIGTSAIGTQRVLIDLLMPDEPSVKCSFKDGVEIVKTIYACHYSNSLASKLVCIQEDFENYSTISDLKYP